MNRSMWRKFIVFGVALLLSTMAVAQEETGNIYVKVSDTAGQTLPGVNVELTGGGAPKLGITNAQGETRFLGLSPGLYAMRASLDGFSTVEYPNVQVAVSRNTTIEVQLSAAIGEVITVTSESPLLDERRLTAGTTISQVELESIPSARDPWAIVSQAPGVMTDRVNVGGNESGQQSVFRGMANNGDENDFLVDGVQITDMSAIGSSPTYYDFDQFQEIQLATGGPDVSKAAAGVSVNMVTKRGTNEFRGTARFLLTDSAGYFGALEGADSGVSESDLGPGQDNYAGDTVDRIQEFGFEAGGPAWRDRVWLWASWGQNDINRITGGGQSDRTILEGTAIKLNAQFTSANSFVASFNNGDKRKIGRGASPSNDPSATWNQRGPTGITKIEDTHVFGSNLFLTGQYSFVDGGFSLTAQGGAGSGNTPDPFPGGEQYVNGTGFQVNAASGGNSRPTEEFKIDGSYFFTTSSLNHEVKFGGRIREASTESGWSYPGRNLFHYDGGFVGVRGDAALGAAFGLPPSRADDYAMVYAYRQGPVPVITNYDSLWVQDTMTMGSWTFNVGFRYDNQDGLNSGGTVDANGGFPTEMPALDFAGNDADGLAWSSITPRLGVTYALGEERKTLIRGSFSQFPDVLSLGNISRTNPLAGNLMGVLFVDDPGGFPGFYDNGEQFAVLGGFWGFDPGNPTSLSSANKNDSGMDAPLTNELILGAEHSFLPEFVVSGTVTWRQVTDVQDFQRLFRNNDTGAVTTIPASEYVQSGTIEGTIPGIGGPEASYSWQTFAADPAKWSNTGGSLFTNGDREIDYLGATVSFTKRLANQWMMRGYFQYNIDETWNVPSSYFNNNDPNRVLPGVSSGAVIDGSTYVIQSTGSGRNDSWLQSTWSWNLNGMYQVAPDRPWGFNVAANLTGREGYPIPYYRNNTPLDGISRSYQVATNIEDYRLDDLAVMDMRIEKEFMATGNMGLTFSIDAFNIFNEGVVLDRRRNTTSGDVGWISTAVAPRVFRLGVRLSWR